MNNRITLKSGEILSYGDSLKLNGFKKTVYAIIKIDNEDYPTFKRIATKEDREEAGV